MRQPTLDCSTLDSTIASLGHLWRRSGDEVSAVLLNATIDPGDDIETQPLKYLSQAFGKWTAPAGVHWFHATRQPRGTLFSQGLLPMTEAEDCMWNLLGQFATRWVSSEEWTRFRSSWDGPFAEQHLRKLAYALEHGHTPNGTLIYETVLNPESVGARDYLRCGSEIVSDIALAFEERYGHDLRAVYLAQTSSCVVTFRLPYDGESDSVRTAACYSFRKLRRLGLGRDCVCCCDAGGITVPASEIVAIRFLRTRGCSD